MKNVTGEVRALGGVCSPDPVTSIIIVFFFHHGCKQMCDNEGYYEEKCDLGSAYTEKGGFTGPLKGWE